MRHPTQLVGLTMEREALYLRIDARVDEIVAAGAIDEVLRAEAEGASASARKALGYQELLAGDVEAMKRHSRNYARRQLTWMRKLADVNLIDLSGRSANDAAVEIVGSATGPSTDADIDCGALMRFEKWQALGNDYLIIEQGALPFELTAERIAGALR